MKKWITTIAIIILPWSGSITAVELSKEGCKELRSSQLRQAIESESPIDEMRAEELIDLEIEIKTKSKLGEAARKQYCERAEIIMEAWGMKENDQEWHYWLLE